jgi:hypothetical protein
VDSTKGGNAISTELHTLPAHYVFSLHIKSMILAINLYVSSNHNLYLSKILMLDRWNSRSHYIYICHDARYGLTVKVNMLGQESQIPNIFDQYHILSEKILRFLNLLDKFSHKYFNLIQL